MTFKYLIAQLQLTPTIPLLASHYTISFTSALSSLSEIESCSDPFELFVKIRDCFYFIVHGAVLLHHVPLVFPALPDLSA